MGVCDLSKQKILVVPPDKYMLCVHKFNFKSDYLPPKSTRKCRTSKVMSHIHEIMEVSMHLTVHRMYSTSISPLFCISSTGGPTRSRHASSLVQRKSKRVEGNWGTVNLAQHTVLQVEGRIVPGMLHRV